MISRLKNYIKISLSLIVLAICLVLSPLALTFRVITELWCLLLAMSVDAAGSLGNRLWSFLARLFPVFIIGCIFCLTACENHSNFTNIGKDTIVIKTDSCHFYMDSAYYTIDELKIEYQNE